MPKAIPFESLVQGLILRYRPHTIPRDAFSMSDNMLMSHGELQMAPGYKLFNGQVVSGSVMGTFEFELENGTTHLLLLTTTKIYRYDEITDTFVSVTRQSLGVDLDYTGTIATPWKLDVIVNPAGDLMVVATNHLIDDVQRWDGNILSRFVALGGGPWKAASVAGYLNHLFMLNVISGATNLPRLLRWSNNGQPEVFNSGDAGFLTLFQGASHGVQLEQLGDYLVAYRREAIHIINFIGSPFFFGQRQVVKDTGLLASRALLNLGTRHALLGTDDVYVFNGVELIPVAHQIREVLFETMDPFHVDKSLILFDEPTNIMMLIVPSANSDGIPDTWWFWNLTENNWSGPIRGRKITGGGDFRRRLTSVWDATLGTWDDQQTTWDHAGGTEAFPIHLFGNEAQELYEIDPTIATALDTPVTGRFESATLFPGRELQPPCRETTIVGIHPIAEEAGSPLRWYVMVSDSADGEFVQHGPYTKGVRGIVDVKPTTGRWFRFAVEGEGAFHIGGFTPLFERSSTTVA